MSSCLDDSCDNSKITGSGWCLRHWINQRFFPLIAGFWISGFIAGRNKYLVWIGLVFALFLAYAYKRDLDDIDNLQEHIQKHGPL